MNAPFQSDYILDSPYPGTEPFSYAGRNIFFGRETEARTLIRLIVLYRGVLLYSDSGAGKSSLVNAGLIPLAIDEGFQPERIRVQPRSGEEIIVERLSEIVGGGPPLLPSVFAPDEKQTRAVLSVEKFLETLRERAGAVRPLLIFDQFEEWVTLFEEYSTGQVQDELETSKERILNALVELVNDSELPVKVLIVLREDYLAKLTPLFKRCPSLPDHYVRLSPLKGDQVYRAIRGPFEEYPGRYRTELSPSLAKEIQKQFEGRSRGIDIRLTEVQIVCRILFETGKQGPELEQVFTDQGGVKGILEMYLEHALESLEIEHREPAVGLLTRMVTSAGTRNVISRDDLLSRVALEDGTPRELLSKTLDSLDRLTLVRRQRLREVYYYEIASEFLVGWILKEAQRQRLTEQRKLLEQEEAGRGRVFRGLAAGLAVALLIAGLAAFTAFQQRNAARSDLARAYNLMCRWGSLEGQAERVLPECERAVELEPDNGSYRDSRGLARALTGDYAGAIEDFQFYVEWGQNKQPKERLDKRRDWIWELEAGRNPFDEATLEALRYE